MKSPSGNLDEEELIDDLNEFFDDEEELTDDDLNELFGDEEELDDDDDDLDGIEFDEDDDMLSEFDDMLEDIDDDFTSTDEYKDLVKQIQLKMIMDSYAFINWSQKCNQDVLSSISTSFQEKSELSNYESLSDYRTLAFSFKKHLIKSGVIQTYNLFMYVSEMLLKIMVPMAKEIQANKKKKILTEKELNILTRKFLLLNDVKEHVKTYQGYFTHEFIPFCNQKNLIDRFYKLVEMLKYIWELPVTNTGTNASKELKQYFTLLQDKNRDLSQLFNQLHNAEITIARHEANYRRAVESGRIKENADGSYPTNVQAMIDNYNREVATNKAIVEDTSEQILNTHVFPKKIEFIKGRCHVTCTCGNVMCDDENCSEDIFKNRFITFNIIQYETSELSLFRTGKVPELLELCNGKDVRTFETLLKELNECTYVFDKNNTLSNSDIAIGFDRDTTVLNAIDAKAIKTYLNRSYGYGCIFSPFLCSACGKIILLQPKLLRYLSAWHASHGSSVYSDYSGSTSTGFIIYKDSVMNDLLSDYVKSIDSIADTITTDLNKKISSLEESVDDDEAIELITTRNALYQAKIEHDIVSVDESDYADDVVHHPDSGIEEVYKRVMMRKNNFMVSTSIYRENTNRNNNVSIGIEDKNCIVPSSYWVNYNQSDEDKFYSPLKFLVESESICNSITPLLALNSLFKSPCFSEYRESIVMYGLLNRIRYNYDLCKKYINVSVGAVTTVIYNSPNGLLTVQLDTVIRILDLLQHDLIALNKKLSFYNEDEISDIDCTDVSPSTISAIDRIVNTLINNKTNEINVRYSSISNPLTIGLFKIDYNDELDEEVLQFISDEIPWKSWSDFAMLFMLFKNNSKILGNFAPSSATNSMKISKGATRLLNAMKDRMKMSHNNSVLTEIGDRFLSKIPPFLRDAKINKNGISNSMFDCVLRKSVFPLPITGKLMPMIHDQTPNDEIIAYLKGQEYLTELYSYDPDEDIVRTLIDANTSMVLDDLKDFYNSFI